MDLSSRLTVFAMTAKGHAVLTALFTSFPGLVAAVVVGKDPSVENDHAEEISALCARHGVPIRRRADKSSIGTGYTLAVAWRWLIDAGASRLIVMHDSLLPRHRGFNPLVTALIEGDAEIGVTALYATADYDRGDVIAQASSPVAHPMRIADAIELVCVNYRDIALRIGEFLFRGEVPRAQPQDERVASYSLWRDDDDYTVDWSLDSARIQRMVYALGRPYKGAASTMAGRSVRIREASMHPDAVIANRSPGKVIFMDQGRPVVVCGQGLLRLDEIVDATTFESLLPLGRFRVRFGS
jgi:methionyl-tRNA formyltransferase